jgi:hypothetical protein
MNYAEVEDLNYNISCITSQQRTASINKLNIIIEDCVIEQYWIKDDERGTILNNKGDKMLFDTDKQAIMYFSKNILSSFDKLMNRMKSFGFNMLEKEEKELIIEYNKKNKTKK